MTVPTADGLKEEMGVSDDRICLTIEEDDWVAICGPDVSPLSHGAPFGVEARGDAPDEETLGDMFEELFFEQVDRIYEAIEDSDDKLETINELDAGDLT